MVAVLVLMGCGGGSEMPTGDDKESISTAALAISANCIGGDADESEVEDGVTTLIAESDEAGDKRFTLSETFTNVTVDDIIRERVKFMRENDCAPEQVDRLEDAAG